MTLAPRHKDADRRFSADEAEFRVNILTCAVKGSRPVERGEAVERARGVSWPPDSTKVDGPCLSEGLGLAGRTGGALFETLSYEELAY